MYCSCVLKKNFTYIVGMRTGELNRLKVLRLTSIGAYLDDGADGILLPRRFVPEGLNQGDEVDVFVYHDSENRLIATTQQPKAYAGEIARLRVVNVTDYGAFMDVGTMKDVFIPKSNMRHTMRVNVEYIVKLYIDEKTGRLTATQKFDYELQNESLTVQEGEEVHLLTYRRTDIGYVMIINNRHTGVLHFNEIYRQITEGLSLIHI